VYDDAKRMVSQFDVINRESRIEKNSLGQVVKSTALYSGDSYDQSFTYNAWGNQSSFTSNFWLRTFASGCYYMDTATNDWSSYGMEILEDSNLTHTHCISSHLTTFAGGFMGFIASTDDTSFENMKRAVIAGSALASFCVEKFGTERLTEITKQDFDQRVSKFVTLANFEMNQLA
jgi:hypothetical protein